MINFSLIVHYLIERVIRRMNFLLSENLRENQTYIIDITDKYNINMHRATEQSRQMRNNNMSHEICVTEKGVLC